MTRFLLFVALCAALIAPAWAAPLSQITVTADGQASAAPDMAQAAFTISTGAATAAAATADNNTRYNRLLHDLRALGIAESDVSTTSFNLNYNPPPKPPELPQQGQRYGYSVFRAITVTVHQLTLVGKVVDTAVGAGVTDVNGVTFDTSDRRGPMSRALRDAIELARVHADAMAAAADLHIVRVKVMQEGAPSLVRPVVTADVFRAAAPAVPTVISPSAVQARATVTVTYEAQ